MNLFENLQILNESNDFYGKDDKTGIEYGINIDGDLYLGDDKSGYNLKDTPENRKKVLNDFKVYTTENINKELEPYARDNENFLNNKMIITVYSGLSADGFMIKITNDDKDVYKQQYRYGVNSSYDKHFANENVPYVSDIIKDLMNKYNVNKDDISIVAGKNIFKDTLVDDKTIERFKKYLDENKEIKTEDNRFDKEHLALDSEQMLENSLTILHSIQDTDNYEDYQNIVGVGRVHRLIKMIEDLCVKLDTEVKQITINN